MRCFTGIFHFTSRFSFLPRIFLRVLDTNMLVSKIRVKLREKRKKNARKTQEKRKKNARKIKNVSLTRDNVSILHYALGKNASQLRFSRVLLAFLFTNANPTHSVIVALVTTFCQ